MSDEGIANTWPPGAPTAGEVFAEKYRIDHLLGVGGMGYVLGATHLQLQERVAIKMLLPERTTQPDTVQRFLREGRAAVRIRSEHVARVLDVGSDAGAPYIVMEYLEGADLAAVLHHQKRISVEKAVDYILQACEAIAEAHAMHTVHRDLKPGNLFVIRRPDGRECIKLLDFGISKTSNGNDDGAMTKTATAIGTPLYMSPEQLKSAKNVDARTDIWALGVILFELVAGRTPFRADSIAELSVQILTTTAPDVRQYTPEAPEAFALGIARCLRRDARERFPSVSELADAIASFGTAGARESATTIAQVLANVARPESVPFLPGGAGGRSDVSFASSTASASQTGGTWGTASGITGADPPETAKPRSRSTTKWVVGGAFAIVVLGSGGGAAIGKLVGRGGDTAATSSAPAVSETAKLPPPVVAPPSAAQAAPTDTLPPALVDAGAETTASISARPSQRSPSTNPPQAVHLAPRPKQTASNVAKAPAPPATLAAPTPTPPPASATPTKSNNGFVKGRFGNDD